MPDRPPVILCVEDDLDTQEMLVVLLQQRGYHCQVVDNCADAVRLIREKDIALVLTDNVLVDGSGVELCRQVRRFNKRLPIVFLSGSIYENAQDIAISSGADAFLAKPFVLDDLYATLAQYVPITKN